MEKIEESSCSTSTIPTSTLNATLNPEEEAAQTLFNENLKEVFQDFQILLPYEENMKRQREEIRIKNPEKRSPAVRLDQSCDLVIVLDCTGSMSSMIDLCRTYILQIISNVKKETGNSEFRVGFVAYRDHCDKRRIEKFDFIKKDYAEIEYFISMLHAEGGGDAPEDLAGGLNTALNELLITDAPCHGRKYHEVSDNHPEGDPNGLDIEDLIHQIGNRRIDLTFVKLAACTDTMFKIFSQIYQEIRGVPMKILELKEEFSMHMGAQNGGGSSKFLTEITKTVMSTISHTSGDAGNPKKPATESDKFYRKAFQILRAHKGLLNTACLSKTELEFSNLTLEQQSEISQAASRVNVDATQNAILEEEDEEEDEDDDSNSENSDDEERKDAHDSSSSDVKPKLPPGVKDDSLKKKYIPKQALIKEINQLEPSFNLSATCLTPYVAKSGKIDWCNPTIKVQQLTSKLKVAQNYFQQGAMRYAFHALDIVLNQKLVAKLHKRIEDNSDFSLMKRDSMSLIACRYFADEFNSRNLVLTDYSKEEAPILLNFVDSTIYEVIGHMSSDVKYYFVENFIDDTYQKFNNNAGWTSGDNTLFNNITQAFSHFTWQFSQGQLLAVDIQGGQNGVLTDPQIHTKNRSKIYGKGDLGYEGMLRFFYTHQCNEFCERLQLIHPMFAGVMPEKFTFFSALCGFEEQIAEEKSVSHVDKDTASTVVADLKAVEEEIPEKKEAPAKKQKKKRGFALKVEEEKERLRLEKEQYLISEKIRIAKQAELDKIKAEAAEKKPEIFINSICTLCKKTFSAAKSIVFENRKLNKESICEPCQIFCNASLLDLACMKCGNLFQISKHYCKVKKCNLIGQCEKCRDK